jgi:hypothetical protein
MTPAPVPASIAATTEDAEVIAVMTPLLADLAADGAGAVALAGSRGKGRSDDQSDYDFRVYAHAYRDDLKQTRQWQRFESTMRAWQAEGLRMDGIWMRHYAGVDRDLTAWLAGTAIPKSFEWTIWDYQLPVDLHTQQIIHDPEGRLAGWKEQLSSYPEPLRAALLARYRHILRYWAKDYHYESKVDRRDLVFLVGITGKLANAIMQVLFALNRAYFPGDGWNLPMAAELPRLPPNFISRMTSILDPGHGPDAHRRQRAELIAMIADVEVLIAA